MHAQLPFTLSFLVCYQDAREKGSDLIYVELHFMTFAPGTKTFYIRRAIMCIGKLLLEKEKRMVLYCMFTICIKSDHTSVFVFVF